MSIGSRWSVSVVMLRLKMCSLDPWLMPIGLNMGWCEGFLKNSAKKNRLKSRWPLDCWRALYKPSCACFQSCRRLQFLTVSSWTGCPLCSLASRTYSSPRGSVGQLCFSACQVCHWWSSSSVCAVHATHWTPLQSSCWLALSLGAGSCWAELL